MCFSRGALCRISSRQPDLDECVMSPVLYANRFKSTRSCNLLKAFILVGWPYIPNSCRVNTSRSNYRSHRLHAGPVRITWYYMLGLCAKAENCSCSQSRINPMGALYHDVLGGPSICSFPPLTIFAIPALKQASGALTPRYFWILYCHRWAFAHFYKHGKVMPVCTLYSNGLCAFFLFFVVVNTRHAGLWTNVAETCIV